MDDKENDKDNNMVKMTIKRADDATKDEKWVCKRIEDDKESATSKEMEPEANESFPAQDEKSTIANESAENLCHTIPSCPNIEMEEGDNQKPSRRNSMENSSNTSMTDSPTSSRNPLNSASTYTNNPLNLSTSQLKGESGRDKTNFSGKGPNEAHTSQGKYPANPGGCIAPNVTGTDRIMQGVPAYHLPGTVGPQNGSLIAINEQVNRLAMAMPSTSNNFSRNTPVANVIGNPEKHNAIPYGNVLFQRIGDHFVNIPPINPANNLMRLYENSGQIITNDALMSVGPPMKRKWNEVYPMTYYCSACGKNFNNDKSYNKHLLTKGHLAKAKRISPPISNLQPNLGREPSEQTNLQTHSLPPPHILQSMQFQMFQQFQAQAMAPSQDHSNQNFKSKAINNSVEQNYGGDATNVNYEEESSSQLRSQNSIGKGCYPQNTRLVNPPLSKPQGIILPSNPQSKFTIMANPNTLGNLPYHPSPSHCEIPVQIQPERYNQANYPQIPGHMNRENSLSNNPRGFLLPTNSRSINSMVANPSNLGSRASNSSLSNNDISAQVQSEGLNCAVQSVTQHQKDSFRIYHCMVCSIFKTSSWRELELHIYADRSKTPLGLVIPFSGGLICKLCEFISKDSTEMTQHCTSTMHLEKVSYYNHLTEGGQFRIADVFNDIHRPFWVFCAACEYVAESMNNLQAHIASRNHQFNIDCHSFIDSFSAAVEFCVCKPCDLKTLTKEDFLVHIRSREHKIVLEEHTHGKETLDKPRQLFYIKELSEHQQITDQNPVNTFVGRYEKNDGGSADNLSSNSSDSTSSSSSKPQSVFCPLCQQGFPEISILEHHLQGQHDVNEAGVKWVVSTVTKAGFKVHEIKSMLEKESTNTKKRRVKSRTFWPKVYSTENEKLPMLSNHSSLHQGSVVSDQLVAVHQNSNQETITSSSSSQKFNEIESKINSSDQNENLTLNLFATSKGVYSDQQLHKTEGILNVDILNQNNEVNHCRRSSSFGSLSHSEQFHTTEADSNIALLNQSSPLNSRISSCTDPTSKQDLIGTESVHRLELHKENKMNTNSTPKKQFCKTKNNLPEKEKVPNSGKRKNFDSSHHEITVENDADSSDNSMYVIETEGDSSGHLSSTDTGSLISHSVFNTSLESNDSLLNDDISERYERLQSFQKPISSSAGSNVIDSLTIQHDHFDSEKKKPSEDYQPNLGLKRKEDNDSSVNNLDSFVESKGKDNSSISIKIENSEDIVMNLNECEKQFYTQNSPTESNSQLEAEKNIGNIEISGFFSLQGLIHHSSNNGDDGTEDFDIYSGL